MKRLRQTRLSTEDEEEIAQDFPNIGLKTGEAVRKSRNVAASPNKGYMPDFCINENLNQVYGLDDGRMALSGEAGFGDESAGGVRARQPAAEETRSGGRGGWDIAPDFPRGASAQGRAAEVGGTDRTAEYTRVLPAQAGETDWAEQADRAFRRDSRRYDGGFYLY